MIQRGVIKHPKEKARLEALRDLNITETPLEERFERITRLVSRTLDIPICAVSCVDLHRQWFKSIQGLDVEQTDRCVAFCQHTILNDEIMVINDARFDDRFDTNPLVTGDPGIVFYAGAPIYSPDGLPVATLCVIDREPRSFGEEELQILYDFARIVESLLHTPRESVVEEHLINQIGESWRASMIDPLTRVWNAEGIKLLTEESIKHAEQSEEQVCIAMLDLNGVNRIRSDLGQPAGDAHLSSFTKAALETMNQADSIGRLCDKEFAMILTRVNDADDAVDRLAKLQLVADTIKVDGIDGIDRLGTRTAGVLIAPHQYRSITSVLEQVENAIAQARSMECPSPQIFNYTDGSSPADLAA